jgi:hypothetical protein
MLRGLALIALLIAGCGGDDSPNEMMDLGTNDLAGAVPGRKDMAHLPPDMANPVGLTCAPSPCWDSCAKNGTSTSTCKSICDLGDGSGCWKLCTASGTSVSTCKSYCGADPGCAATLCWENCGANDVSTSTCDSYCGHDKTTCASCSPASSAWSQCWALCTANGTSTSTCASYCDE